MAQIGLGVEQQRGGQVVEGADEGGGRDDPGGLLGGASGRDGQTRRGRPCRSPTG
ncbi:hypothetical protein SHIRM173S_09461 [Streptomyces hirsutus]